MQEPDEIRRRKRRSNRSVLLGVVLMALGLLVSAADAAPPLVTTLVAVLGFALVLYGVHVGWLIFYEREPDGPSS